MIQVILVDDNDQPIGEMEKMEVHEKGLLHRAFSVFLVNDRNEVLLQQRAASKYHSPLLWTNACCSHPSPGESLETAVSRRLGEELGISATTHKIFDFTYKADVGQGLTEHEYDHVFFGKYTGDFNLNPDEVASVKYVSFDEVHEDLLNHGDQYTEWFKICFDQFYQYAKRHSLKA